jgi:hypothetical protein
MTEDERPEDGVIREYANARSPQDLYALAGAMRNRAAGLWAKGRPDEALTQLDTVVARLRRADEPMLRRQVAYALANKTAMLRELGKTDEALVVL